MRELSLIWREAAGDSSSSRGYHLPMVKNRPPADGDSSRREWVKLMNLSVLGIVFPVSLVLGYFAGRWIGSFFDAVRVGGMIGAIFGLLAGFYNMFKMVSQMGSDSSRAGDDGAD